MIYALALRTAIDETVWVEGLLEGETARAACERAEAGGKAVNLARALWALGAECRLFGAVGEENGERFCRLLGHEAELVRVPGAVRENLSVIAGDRFYKIDRQGYGLPEGVLSALGERMREAAFSEARPLTVFSGSLPGGVSVEEYRDLVLSFRERGARIALDSDFWTAADLQTLRPFVIKPNRKEFSRLTGREFSSVRETAEAAEKLSGTVRHVIVSLDREGLLYAGGGRLLWAAVPQIEGTGCVGAGDSTLAGFLAALERGRPEEECVRFAAACGCASAKRRWGSIPTLSEAERSFQEVRLSDWSKRPRS